MRQKIDDCTIENNTTDTAKVFHVKLFRAILPISITFFCRRSSICFLFKKRLCRESGALSLNNLQGKTYIVPTPATTFHTHIHTHAYTHSYMNAHIYCNMI